MVEQFRSFSRTVTQRVGALNDRFMERNRPLAQSRMLWEIGLEGCEIRLLRSRLGLDSGHASRLLRSLEAEGLVVVEPSVSDRRVRMARLTARGRHERALLDERSDEHARVDPGRAGPRAARAAGGRDAHRRAVADRGRGRDPRWLIQPAVTRCAA